MSITIDDRDQILRKIGDRKETRAFLAAAERTLESWCYFREWRNRQISDREAINRIRKAAKLAEDLETVLRDLSSTDLPPDVVSEANKMLGAAAGQNLVVSSLAKATLAIAEPALDLTVIAAALPEPKKHRRKGYPRVVLLANLARVWREHLGTPPTATREGPFEQVARILLIAAGAAREDTDIYNEVRDAVVRGEGTDHIAREFFLLDER